MLENRKIIQVEKNSSEDCLKFELEIEKQKNKELQEQVSMLLNQCNSMMTTVYHMPDLDEVIKCYKERDKLKKALEILIRDKLKPSAFIGTSKLYKRNYGVEMPYEKAVFLIDFIGTEEEYELLKEVLNEKED